MPLRVILIATGIAVAMIKMPDSGMRVFLFIRDRVLPPLSFGLFVAAEGAVLYVLYHTFVAPR